MIFKIYVTFFFLLTFQCSIIHYSFGQGDEVEIKTAGNSWVINDVFETSKVISKGGIAKWSDPNQVIRTFFHVEKVGKFSMAINAKVAAGTSKIIMNFNGSSKKVSISNTSFKQIELGTFQVSEAGYHFIELQGLKKESDYFAEVKEIILQPFEGENRIRYIKDDVYFGRRGPSTHLVYQIPDGTGDIEWFYNEIEIDEGQDVIGSYFMANGFAEGYFGIQVNSPKERRILFSVWSPYKTDDPSSIPEEYRIKLLKKGEEVHAGKFGNEGSGGQSYKVFNWKTNTRYGFLLGAKPTGDSTTVFTAYFYDPVFGDWQLIASFQRPKTDTHLKKLYSFLENFIPNTGVLTRKGDYFNQWVYNTRKGWVEIRQAKFSADATARKEARLDYSGGIDGNHFYLKNCGFTNDNTQIGEILLRNKTNTPPLIDFSTLE